MFAEIKHYKSSYISILDLIKNTLMQIFWTVQNKNDLLVVLIEIIFWRYYSNRLQQERPLSQTESVNAVIQKNNRPFA